MKRAALDGADRRRLYLFRHGAVDYVRPDGSWVEDPDAVPLNPRGREQAAHLAGAFADVAIDKAICSGLPRTLETATTVLGERDISIGVHPELEEIRPAKGEQSGGYDPVSDVAFSHWRAEDPESTFLGGERYSDFYLRVTAEIERIVADESWHNLAAFAHGGTNAAVLGWVTGLGASAFGLFDQQTCCLNVIDFDVRDGVVLRKTLRAVNITSMDPMKSDRHASDMELLAKRLIKMGAT
ncbi:MAG: histidine phosphatase family protein [Pseudomonadota bacterium]